MNVLHSLLAASVPSIFPSTQSEQAPPGAGGDDTPPVSIFDRAGEQTDNIIEYFSALLAQYLKVPAPVGGLIANVAVVIGILVVSRIFAGIISSLLTRAFKRSKFEHSQLFEAFIRATTRNVIVLMGLLIALQTIGVSVGPLVAGLGIAGFVVGFALQDTLGNFAAGVMVLLYRPFDVGDFIKAAGVDGTVESMTLVSTTLKTPDNQQIIVPNGKIWGDVITNVTAKQTRRIDLTFGIGYSDDIDQAMRVLRNVVEGHELILPDPEVNIQVHSLGDSSVNLICRPWAKTVDYWTVYWDLQRQVKQRFDAEDISIPFPQRNVHLFTAESGAPTQV